MTTLPTNVPHTPDEQPLFDELHNVKAQLAHTPPYSDEAAALRGQVSELTQRVWKLRMEQR